MAMGTVNLFHVIWYTYHAVFADSRHTAGKSYLKGTATARRDMTPVARYFVFQGKPETQVFVLVLFLTLDS